MDYLLVPLICYQLIFEIIYLQDFYLNLLNCDYGIPSNSGFNMKNKKVKFTLKIINKITSKNSLLYKNIDVQFQNILTYKNRK